MQKICPRDTAALHVDAKVAQCQLSSQTVRSAHPLALTAPSDWLVAANSSCFHQQLCDLQPLLAILLMQRFDPQTIMFPASFFCPGQQSRFATCFTPNSKEGGVLAHQHSLGTLLTQLLVCSAVVFPRRNSHKLATVAVAMQNKSKFPINIQTRSAKMQFHSTLTEIMTA